MDAYAVFTSFGGPPRLAGVSLTREGAETLKAAAQKRPGAGPSGCECEDCKTERQKLRAWVEETKIG